MSRFLVLALLSAGAVLPQTAQPEGVWHSDEKYNGEPRVVITVRVRDGKVGGQVVMRGVIDDDNNSTTLNLVIDSAKLDGGTLSFQTKLPDDNITEWEMTTNGSTGTASMVGDRDGPFSDPQRWKVKRVEPSTSTSPAPQSRNPLRARAA